MKQEGFATTFERLERDVSDWKRRAALGELFAWNWQAKLDARIQQQPELRKSAWDWCELGAMLLAVTLALCSCKERETPDRSDPFEPPPIVMPVRPVHVGRLMDGSIVAVLVREEL